MKTPLPTNPREVAFRAVLESLKQNQFASDYLDEWRQTEKPNDLDFRFAQEIANGSIRMGLALDILAKELTGTGKLSLKPKERALLRTALYQHYYMTKVPLFALTDESIKIAKRTCHPTFVGFLNKILRKIATVELPLPDVTTSYPTFYVEKLTKEQGEQKAREILTAGNTPAPVMARVRDDTSKFDNEVFKWVTREHPAIVEVVDTKKVPQVAAWKECYIQNWTPAKLMDFLIQSRPKAPESILDLCAAPGGKLLAVHDAYPHARLHANDVSPEKLSKIQENARKYDLNVTLFCQKGEEFTTQDKYDLVIVDAPCSNTGVLNKRPEARFRLSEEAIAAQLELQKKLLTRALQLIQPEGEVWYLTCSILRDENEGILKKMGVRIRNQMTLLPNLQGQDGGYGASLTS